MGLSPTNGEGVFSHGGLSVLFHGAPNFFYSGSVCFNGWGNWFCTMQVVVPTAGVFFPTAGAIFSTARKRFAHKYFLPFPRLIWYTHALYIYIYIFIYFLFSFHVYTYMCSDRKRPFNSSRRKHLFARARPKCYFYGRSVLCVVLQGSVVLIPRRTYTCAINLTRT